MDLALQLKETLLEKLRTQEWRAGARLPTERALSQDYGIGRSTVRRVLGELKRQRLITQRVGSGTYVADAVQQALQEGLPTGVPAAPAVSPAELMAARLVLEPALLDLVVGNATRADFAAMDHCNDRAEAARSLAEFEHWDAALHACIAAAAHNGFMAGVFRLVNEARAQGEWGVLKRRSASAARRLAYQGEHRALVEALRQRDLERARALCRAHLLHVRSHLLGD